MLSSSEIANEILNKKNSSGIISFSTCILPLILLLNPLITVFITIQLLQKVVTSTR